MSILALDLGTNTGWAISTGTKVHSGVQSFKSGRYDGGGMRYLRFQKWLDEVTDGVQEVYFEEVRRHLSTDSAHVYGGLLATLTAFCENRKLPYSGIPVGTIKKSATGKGNAGKEDVIKAMQGRGYAVSDDNQADALALLHCVIDGK